jgi:hypothetical protein
VLVCAPSNAALDELVLRLVAELRAPLSDQRLFPDGDPDGFLVRLPAPRVAAACGVLAQCAH